ncbi:unnamed protein product [Caenorhabditis nigoni]
MVSESNILHFHVNDVPHFTAIILFGLQQMLVCISALLVTPYLLSNMLCAGAETIAIRSSQILLIRLAILHGPSFAFLPALHTFEELYPCTSETDTNQWKEKMQLISGSLFLAVLIMPIMGVTGLVGKISKHIGPITIVPMLVLLCIGTVPDIQEKVSLHWISIVEILLLIVFVVLLEDLEIPIPGYSFSEKKFIYTRLRMFSQFPYLLGICIACFQLIIAFTASTVVVMIESVGNYGICAQISQQGSPPSSSINRAFVVEGVGSMLAALMGCGTGVTTYSENIAIMQVTKVTSRITMQCAGVFLILMGVVSKVAAFLAMIPEAIIGGVLAAGMSMVCGVAFANLQNVDLRLSRNLTIVGLSIILGCTIPAHFEKKPLDTGHKTMDDVLGTLLKMRMLVGGLIAFCLDLMARGATRKQRGLEERMEQRDVGIERDGFAFSRFANQTILKIPSITKLPVMPSEKSIRQVEELRNKGDMSKQKF